MDLIFISKILILTIIYLCLNFLYKKIDWKSKPTKNGKVFLFLGVLISIVPLFSAVIVLIIFLILKGSFEFLIEKTYLEQIIVLSGYFLLYFIIRFQLDKIELKVKEKNEIINQQSKKISMLERQIKENKNSIKERLAKMPIEEKAKRMLLMKRKKN